MAGLSRRLGYICAGGAFAILAAYYLTKTYLGEHAQNTEQTPKPEQTTSEFHSALEQNIIPKKEPPQTEAQIPVSVQTPLPMPIIPLLPSQPEPKKLKEESYTKPEDPITAVYRQRIEALQKTQSTHYDAVNLAYTLEKELTTSQIGILNNRIKGLEEQLNEAIKANSLAKQRESEQQTSQEEIEALKTMLDQLKKTKDTLKQGLEAQLE
ncbi:hypothetical protein HY486_04580 [Candidatus Woesearchaeota archaeon]|nr:hypothetical protein [Candidatus Woesearchaeota archaeon]